MATPFIRNLQRGFGLSLLLLLISSVAAYLCITELKRQGEQVNHTNTILQQSENITSLLNDAETGQRGFLLTKDDHFLAPYLSAASHIYISIDSLAKLTADNPRQQANCKLLTRYVEDRFNRLDELIKMENAGKTIAPADLLEGQYVMNRAKQLIQNIQSEEQRLLSTRTATFAIFGWVTPLILIFSSLIAIFITINFYRRIKSDYELRVKLQATLEKNEQQTIERLQIIENVASQVSAGNYKVRVSDEEEDTLGKIGFALNKMAADLNKSFEDFERREWLKNGLAELNEKMIGEKDVHNLAKNVTKNIADYTGSLAAAMYVCENHTLALASGISLSNDVKNQFAFGEGLVGKCAETREINVLNNIPQNDITVSYAAGSLKPNNLVVFPVLWENKLKAVLEVVSVQPYSERDLTLFENLSQSIGLSIESAMQNMTLQQLLSETQAQTEELQMQQHELEQLNYDLESQAQKLQVSEEELKVQQEELLQTNQELEERSSLLEEKNQMIVERNLMIQKKAEELETTTKYKSEFLANMSHELRTPLNSILLLSRLIAANSEQNLTAEQVEFASVIQSSGNGLLSLIDEILDLSKIESGKMKVEFRNIHINEIKNNITSLFSPMAKEKNLAFSFDIEEGTPEMMITDSVRLEQILKNLISNALKFTTRGSVKVSVKQDVNQKINFVVKDTGIGIAEEKKLLIFEAFQQADGSTRRKFGGTGLGLSISRELAKLLGGEIKLDSELTHGSEFTLTIPLDGSMAVKLTEQPLTEPVEPLFESEPQAHIDDTNEDFIDQVNVADDRQNIKPGDKMILIVEDDAFFAQTLLSYAQRNRYKGIIALQGDHGIQLAKTYLPNAILLDIKLPVKDGWQVMDELKKDESTRHIPVHMMSSLHAKEESINRGAINFIDKPSTLEKLPDVFNRIEEALQRGPKKILIVEENEKHAQALCYFLESYNINVKGTQKIKEAVTILQDGSADCVVLEMKVFTNSSYEALEAVKNTTGLEHLPIIIFTGKSLSKAEELRIKQVADSIVVKTANSYKRILDEIDVFLQIVEENDPSKPQRATRRLGALEQVLENKTVLIADDDVRNIYSLTKTLEAHKMNVISATDGKDALEQLTQNPKINIVLMDMMMPEMDGYQATETIRKMPQYRNLPILALTAKAMYGDRERCMQAGASDYISKPIDIDQLISLLRVWLYQ